LNKNFQNMTKNSHLHSPYKILWSCYPLTYNNNSSSMLKEKNNISNN
jgi:hypothetical protein